MGADSHISWTDHTFNPWIGCARVSAGCLNCYAEARDHRFGEGLWGKNAPRKITSDANWRQPLKWDRDAAAAGRKAFVFCASLADVFEDRADLLEPRARLFGLIRNTPNLVWLLLTKRPENVLSLVPWEWLRADPDEPIGTVYWPQNVWVGTTVEDQDAAEIRLPYLTKIPARHRFLSCEPLIGRVCLNDALHDLGIDRPPFDWVIVGGESGPGYRPMDLSWARHLVTECHVDGIAVWFKQVGGNARIRGVFGGDRLWANDGPIQERPVV